MTVTRVMTVVFVGIVIFAGAVFTWAMCKSAQKMDKFLERQRKCDGCFGAAWGDCDHCSLNGDDAKKDGEDNE